MANDNQLTLRPKASVQLAAAIGMDPNAMIDAIKAQCFKGVRDQVSNEQLAAFVSIAAEMGVNPFLPDMLYAYPDRGAIIPIMGPSGIYKKLMEHPLVDSWETTVYPEDVTQAPTHAITNIYLKGRERPLSYTALMSEWKVGSNPNWNNRPRHMIGLRSLKHAARQVIHGLPYDEDDRVIMGSNEVNVTPQPAAPAAAPVERPAPPPRSRKGVSAVVENATPPAPKAPVIDVPVAPVPAAPEPEPVPVAAVVEPVASTRAFLKDKEQYQGKIEVVEVTTITANVKGVPTPAIQAKVKGDFNGTVFHFGGAEEVEGKLVPKPIWAAGNTLVAELLGCMNAKSGKVFVKVESAVAAEAGQPAPASQPEAADEF